MAVAQAAAYRFDYVSSLLITFAGGLGFPLVALLIYGAGAAFPGWSFYEVLLIQSLFTMSQALVRCLMGNLLWETMDHVRAGSFETVLLKPMDPLVYMMSTTFSPNSFGNFLCGAVLFVYAMDYVSFGPAGAVLTALILFIAGVAVVAGIQLIMAAVSFKWVGNSRLHEIFSSVEAFGQYPMGIFPSSVRAFATFIVPVGLVGFFPAAALLGKNAAESYASALYALIFLAFGIWIYKRMIKSYQGAGG